jgi:hypothetical protein
VALTPSQIIAAICPELSGNPSLPVFLEMAAEQIDRGFFGKQYPYAVAYKACHLFETSGIGKSETAQAIEEAGNGQQIASMSEGGLSVTFAHNGGGATTGSLDMGSTKYGRMFLDLLKTRPTMGVNTAGGGSRLARARGLKQTRG